MSLKSNKSQQEKEGESVLIWLAKLFVQGLLRIRSGVVTEELGQKGKKRIIFFVEDKDDK